MFLAYLKIELVMNFYLQVSYP